jgi:hypothetical protein
MIKYAAIKNNKVVNLIVFDNPTQEELSDVANAMEVDLLIPLIVTGAGIGSEYIDGVLRPIKDYPSWIWNSFSKIWEAPTPKPEDDKEYLWDESTTSWKVVE